MHEQEEFHSLMHRLRAGEPRAAEELVRRYEPEIRRLVRMQLTDPRLHRLLDSVDIVQSVLANFLLRTAEGEFDLNSPEDLQKLLRTMARNRLRDHARRQTAQRRDQGRTLAEAEEALKTLAAGDDSPSSILADREMLSEVRRRLSPDELAVAELRSGGHEWDEVAAQLGGTAEGLRKRWARAVQRVAGELRLGARADE